MFLTVQVGNPKLDYLDEERGALIPTKDDYVKFSKTLRLIKKQYERYGPRRGLTALNHHMAISQVNHLDEEFFTLRDKMKAEIEARNQEEIF